MKISPKSARPMLFCANGCSRDQLAAEAERVLGRSWTPTPAPDAETVAAARAGKQAAALRLFSGSTPLRADDPAGRYLARRGLSDAVPCAALRFRGDATHPTGGRHPTMVSQVVNADGQPIGAHRTYLTRDGRKADLDPAKMTLGPMWGGAVRLTADPAPPPELVIGEGIESAASAGVLMGLPAWAALSAGNLAAGLMLPSAVRTVTIAADHDTPGRRAAHDAAARWRQEGRTVRIVQPNAPGQDFNDVLRARQEADHAR